MLVDSYKFHVKRRIYFFYLYPCDTEVEAFVGT